MWKIKENEVEIITKIEGANKSKIKSVSWNISLQITRLARKN
jgi:hypothetical protein